MPNTSATLEYIALPHFPRHALGTFLNAMKEGYAHTPTKGTIAELPGSKPSSIDMTGGVCSTPIR